MTLTSPELADMYEQLKRLETQLKKAGAPKTIVLRAHEARLAVNWLLDHKGVGV